MNKHTLSPLFLLLLACAGGLFAQDPDTIGYDFRIRPAECQPGGDRIPVLLLGVYDMANAKPDLFNVQADDVLAPKRQAEIEELVARLAKFQPTKIAVEAPFGDKDVLAKYQAYLQGNYQLGRSETEQIGFRLAKALGHQTIFPIDVNGSEGKPASEKLLADNPEFQELLVERNQTGRQIVSQMDQWLKKSTVTEMLFQLNRPEVIRKSQEFYFQFFEPMADGKNYSGPDFIAAWYQRNLRIFSNLHQIHDSEKDRILVIYGQGHIQLLQRFVIDSPYFCRTDALPYLQR